jgi:molybdate transport system substrate-binding protein
MPEFPSDLATKRLLVLGLGIIVVLGAGQSRAAEALIAVASNFDRTVRALEEEFERTGTHSVTIVSGSTGKLYAQIVNGAPFDAFLSADDLRPALLEKEGRAVGGSRFTYAMGRLCLWGPDPQRIAPDGMQTLRAGDFRRLAIANPRLAPYGAAAQATLRAFGLDEALADRLVMGENVGQVYSIVATGNAELGFVALAQVLTMDEAEAGSRWDVPAELHNPIRQDAVLLRHGESNPAAAEFLRYLRSPAARLLVQSFGYEVE